MKRMILVVLIVMLSASLVSAAATLTETGPTRVLTSIDADYTFTNFINIGAIVFIPGASGQVIVIKSQTDAGAMIVRMTSGDGEERVFYPPEPRMKPMIDFSECTVNSDTQIIFYVR